MRIHLKICPKMRMKICMRRMRLRMCQNLNVCPKVRPNVVPNVLLNVQLNLLSIILPIIYRLSIDYGGLFVITCPDGKERAVLYICARQ